MSKRKTTKLMDVYNGELYVAESGYDSPFPSSIAHHPAKTFDERAAFTMELVKKWGMVAAKDGGEDSSGRSQLKLLTPDEVTSRAVETTTAMFEKIEKLGWFSDIPSMEHMTEVLDDAPETNR